MAVPVATEGELTLGAPTELFERYSPNASYEVGPHGERFLMVDTSESRRPPKELVLVQNWVEELKRLVPRDD